MFEVGLTVIVKVLDEVYLTLEFPSELSGVHVSKCALL